MEFGLFVVMQTTEESGFTALDSSVVCMTYGIWPLCCHADYGGIWFYGTRFLRSLHDTRFAKNFSGQL